MWSTLVKAQILGACEYPIEKFHALPLFGHVALCITFNTMYKGCFSILLINMKNGTKYDET
jgi:hypothetical protein